MWDFQNIGGVSVSSFIFYHRFKSFALFFIALRNTAYSTFLTVLTKNMGASQSLPTHLLYFFIALESISHHCPAAQIVVSLYWDLSGYLPTSQIKIFSLDLKKTECQSCRADGKEVDLSLGLSAEGYCIAANKRSWSLGKEDLEGGLEVAASRGLPQGGW